MRKRVFRLFFAYQSRQTRFFLIYSIWIRNGIIAIGQSLDFLEECAREYDRAEFNNTSRYKGKTNFIPYVYKWYKSHAKNGIRREYNMCARHRGIYICIYIYVCRLHEGVIHEENVLLSSSADDVKYFQYKLPGGHGE